MNKLIAEEGYWLTQANITDEYDRTFSKSVAGFGDLDSLFIQWSDEQKSVWESEYQIEEDITAEEALDIITGNNYE